VKPYPGGRAGLTNQLLCDSIQQHDVIVTVQEEDGLRDRFQQEAGIITCQKAEWSIP
jgi:hypothetical protein